MKKLMSLKVLFISGSPLNKKILNSEIDNGILAIYCIFTIYQSPVPCIFTSGTLYFYNVMVHVKSKVDRFSTN